MDQTEVGKVPVVGHYTQLKETKQFTNNLIFDYLPLLLEKRNQLDLQVHVHSRC